MSISSAMLQNHVNSLNEYRTIGRQIAALVLKEAAFSPHLDAGTTHSLNVSLSARLTEAPDGGVELLLHGKGGDTVHIVIS